MIFKETHDLMLKRLKRQTRRPVKPSDLASHDEKGNIVAVYRKGRLLWRVGKDYAIQPGRGKKSLGRTTPIERIRRERLQKISLKDLQAELGQPGVGYILVFFFIEIWDGLYRKPYDWASNPEVWALDFAKEESSND